MKSSILLLALAAAAFTSCTTAYKTGQTPDDVYFSPTSPQDEYVRVEKNDDRRYQAVDDYYDDRYLRMRVSNRYLWSELDDWYYFGNRYNYSYYPQTGLYYNPWTPSTYWNCHYNPYYGGGYYGGGGGIIINPKSSVYARPRTVNLNTYNNNMLTNSNYAVPGKSGGAGVRNNIFSNQGNSNSNSRGSNYNYSNSNRTSTGSGLRNIFSGNNNSSNTNTNNSSNRNSSNTTTNSSSSSSSSSSGSSGNAPVRKF